MLDGWAGCARGFVFWCVIGRDWRKRSQLGCCGCLCILIASLDSLFDVVNSSGRAVVLWRFGPISTVSSTVGDVLRGSRSRFGGFTGAAIR